MTATHFNRTQTKTVVELSLQDLKQVVKETLQEEKARLEAEAQAGDLLGTVSRNEACKLLNVSFCTLNRWERIGYLIPVRAGRKVYYLKQDIKQLLSK